MTLPVTLIGGYLGAGKTTLVNHLLRTADGLRLAILVNEFGALPIDADLIEARGEKVIAIAGGCVCCSYGSDLMAALMDLEVVAEEIDHVLIETSGVALPDQVARSLDLLAGYAHDGTVVLADAETVRARARDDYLSDTIAAQLESGDLLLLNKGISSPTPISRQPARGSPMWRRTLVWSRRRGPRSTRRRCWVPVSTDRRRSGTTIPWPTRRSNSRSTMPSMSTDWPGP